MLDPETSWHGELVLRVSLLYRFRLHQTQAQLRVDSEHQQIGAQQNSTLGASERVSEDDVWNVNLPGGPSNPSLTDSQILASRRSPGSSTRQPSREVFPHLATGHANGRFTLRQLSYLGTLYGHFVGASGRGGQVCALFTKLMTATAASAFRLGRHRRERSQDLFPAAFLRKFRGSWPHVSF